LGGDFSIPSTAYTITFVVGREEDGWRVDHAYCGRPQTSIYNLPTGPCFNVAAGASPYASYACVDTWLTDFRADLPKFDIPTLVVHGTEDRILPFSATARRLPALIKDLTLVPVQGGPHNIGWTHPDEVNRALLTFLEE
jgi:pimeloyl-ACP methyl ester carboxylesterase